MMRRIFIWLCLVWVLFPAPASAVIGSNLSFRPGEEITLQSDNIDYYRSTNLYVATGGVVIVYGENVLRADKVVLDRAHKVFTASGHIKLTDGKSELFSDRMTAHFDDRTGVIFGGRIFLRDSGYMFTGERIEKVGDEKFIIRRGSITTCNCGPDETPSWNISARSIWVTVGGYARVQNALFYVKGVPVAYLPLGFFPVKKKREFGLLFPNMTYKSTTGFEIHQGVFIPIGDEADATVWADYFTKYNDYGVSGEFRYVWRRGTFGNTYASFRRQAAGENVASGGTYRFEINSTHRYNIGPYEAAIADIHLVSDRRYYAEFAPTLQQKTQQFTHSEVAYLNSTQRVSLLTQAEIFEQLTSSFLPSINRLPHFETVGLPQMLFERGPLLSARVSADNFVSKPVASGLLENEAYRTLGQRADITVRIEQPVHAGPVSLVPFAVGRETGYHSTFGGSDQHREMALLGTRFESPWERRFDYGGSATMPATGVLFHRMSPVSRYLYMPNVNQNANPVFDELDRMRPRNLVEYGFESQAEWFDNPLARAGSASIGIYRHYAFRPTDGSDPNSPVVARVRLDFPIGLGLSVTEYYDPKLLQYKNYNGVYRVDAQAFGGLTAGLEYHRISNYVVSDSSRVLVSEDIDDAYKRYAAPVPWASREVWGTLSRTFLDHLTLLYGGRYSVDRRIFLESIYGATFLSLCNCWSVQGTLIQRPNNDLLASITFTLVGIGSVGKD